MLTAIWQTQPDRPKLEKHTASSLATVSTSACHNSHMVSSQYTVVVLFGCCALTQIASTMLVIVLTTLLLQYLRRKIDDGEDIVQWGGIAGKTHWSQRAHAGGAPAPWAEVRSR